MRHWLTRRAEQKLVPWLRQLSAELNLPFQGASVRGQKTLWASCSGKGRSFLQEKLLYCAYPSPILRVIC
ncbi:YgjP-like metallopeptidase domain-containing protein [Leptolyngbya ohadii]|uniref:YgjP-like metallopeptidase domain-containing protein n=1 Tax=Leptolyngbya ohadii TaxID=1962290 RepID=UPI0034E2D2A9